MLRKLIRPEILFLLGVGQALTPYLIWSFGGGVSSNGANVSYEPVIIWIAAYLSFCLGCRIVSNRAVRNTEFDLRFSGKQITATTLAIAIGLVVQIIWAISVYGTLPILSYILNDGQIDVSTANELQESSAVGQFGLIIVSTLLANGVLLTLLLWNSQTKRLRFLLTAPLVFVLLLANLMNGKRQGLFETILYLFIGIVLWTESPTQVLTALAIIPKSRLLRCIYLFAALAAGANLMGYMASARTQGWSDRSSLEEAISYLEYPIRNLSAQCEQAGGFGPSSFNLLYPFRHLLPTKLIEATSPNDLVSPIKAERTSPSGMFEEIQWSWGITGIVAYTFLLGATCMHIFRMSSSHLRCLLIYPLLGYSLITAHSYNHFLSLTFVPLPCLLLWAYGNLVNPRKRTKLNQTLHVRRKLSQYRQSRSLIKLEFMQILSSKKLN